MPVAVDIRKISEQWAKDPNLIFANIQSLKDTISNAFSEHSSGHWLMWNPAEPNRDNIFYRALCCSIWLEYLHAYSGLVSVPKFNVARCKEVSLCLNDLSNFFGSLPIARAAKKRVIPGDQIAVAATAQIDLELEDLLRNLQTELDIAAEFAPSEENPQKPKAIFTASKAAPRNGARRNKPGNGEELLKAHLRQHHQYKAGNPAAVGNVRPAENSTALSAALVISAGVVSNFFRRWFEGRKRYDEACEREDFGLIVLTLQSMSGDITPRELRKPFEEEARRMFEGH